MKESPYRLLQLDKRDKVVYLMIVMLIIIQFSIFKYLYPFANYIHGDSFSYIDAADRNLNVNAYLIGYSKFLRLFSVFSQSDLILTIFQYLFIELSALFLLYTLFYFYRTSFFWRITLLLVFTINPLFCHLGNLISSDGMFLGVSLVWFSLLIWIVNFPLKRVLIWHGIILLLALTLRYNALLYPILSLIAISLSGMSFRKKILGSLYSILLCVGFIWFTSSHFKKITGVWQFSPFSGWQLANNAMYTYRYVKFNERKPVPQELLSLDNSIRAYFDSVRSMPRYKFIESEKASSIYMWTEKLPLMEYNPKVLHSKDSAFNFREWAKQGPLYKSYGIWIIRNYPKEFIIHFMGPNMVKFFAPPIEFLQYYNTGRVGVTDDAKRWFGYESTLISARFGITEAGVLFYYPVLAGALNFSFLCVLGFYFFANKFSFKDKFSKGIILGSLFWLLNAAFSIVASSVALRFQAFPIYLTVIYVFMILEWLAGQEKASAQEDPMLNSVVVTIHTNS